MVARSFWFSKRVAWNVAVCLSYAIRIVTTPSMLKMIGMSIKEETMRQMFLILSQVMRYKTLKTSSVMCNEA